ncbi:hypothetical protein K402DRAFT_409963 [Aulographum hederae CBS 113979]|uniref:Uncharacterized protein n=1 Tax=Aulographum hederae CBS 113979 TaxID=1176131 RepID=A0A6G1HD18_9PEZI|nr:hypothetical protein K402DRAFT_409963 [Aulographum hederae CBS 113979]
MANDVPQLPPLDAFTFDGILRAVDPDINGAIDAIAEICARSKMSLADEYSAHLPPQGEISATPRMHPAYRVGVPEPALTSVPEASSSSERLAAESRASTSSGKGKVTAYGSLRSIIVGPKPTSSSPVKSKGGSASSLYDKEESYEQETLPGWAFISNSQPSLSPVTSPTTPHASIDKPKRTISVDPRTSSTQPVGPSSFSSWVPWRRSLSSPTVIATPSTEEVGVENRLKHLLKENPLESKPSSQGMG